LRQTEQRKSGEELPVSHYDVPQTGMEAHFRAHGTEIVIMGFGYSDVQTEKTLCSPCVSKAPIISELPEHLQKVAANGSWPTRMILQFRTFDIRSVAVKKPVRTGKYVKEVRREDSRSI
jgi:hypothetical protein